MYLLISKIIFATSIFLLTLVTGLLPLRIAKHNARFLDVCDAFASGIFLSTALLHLLPDAAEKFNAIGGIDYPLAYLICISTFILLLIMERGIALYGEKHFSDHKIMAPIFLVILLSIHSLVEGAAIGINANFLETAAIFFAVLAHKGSESFALSMNLHHSGLATKIIKRVIMLFSMITPLGIFIASSVVYASETTSGGLLDANFCAIAAGTFLYLGTEHLVEGKKSFEQFNEVIALILGVALMALVAIWV